MCSWLILIVGSMQKIKSHIGNFQRCRKLIATYQAFGKDIHFKHIHSFIGWADRNTLRLDCNFHPLQNLMGSIDKQLTTDPFIADKPLMIAKASSIFLNLNYYSSVWAEYASSKLIRYFQSSTSLKIEEVLPIYRMLIQLGWNENQQILKTIRLRAITLLLQQIEQSDLKDFSKFMEKIHRQLRVLLLDPKLQIDLMENMLSKLGARFEQQKLALDKNYHYVHTAMIWELISILKISLNKEVHTYQEVLKQAYDRYKSSLYHQMNSQSGSSQFTRKGQSVFQIRFQKHLQEIGFWFERNKIIGIHEYDIVLKGRLRSDFFPLKRLGQARDLSQVPIISPQQLKIFEGMNKLWIISKKQQWNEPLIINLNGPYHQIYGDRGGCLRSQQIKGLIAFNYGYRRFKTIQFKDWEENTPHNLAAAQYIEQLVASI